MTQNKKEGWELHFDELWNEHDGTHFYKDEFRDFTRSLLHEREEEAALDAVRKILGVAAEAKIFPLGDVATIKSWKDAVDVLFREREEEMVKKAEGLKKKWPDYKKTPYAEFPKESVGWNAALDEVINIIKK